MEELKHRQYSPWSATSYLVVMRHLSLWLEDQKLEPADLTLPRIEAFVEERRRLGYAKGRSVRGMVGVLTTHLRDTKVIPDYPPSKPESSHSRVTDAFIKHLSQQRGLTPNTLKWQRFVANRFLNSCNIEWNENDCTVTVTPRLVIEFLNKEASQRSKGSLHNVMVVVRNLLRFLFTSGWIPRSLEDTVPAVPGWRNAGLIPHCPTESQVIDLLNNCNRHTPTGCRDFAILLILSRLGFRAGEVARLSLDDIDWRQGIIQVRGKGNRYDKLPLPTDVGQAIAEYCQRYRPICHNRFVFVHLRAPHSGLSNGAVGEIVKQACCRAGVTPFRAHRLRHRAAVSMRDAGAPLWEIGQVLRHRRAVTTAHYAKPSSNSTIVVARPWLGGANS